MLKLGLCTWGDKNAVTAVTLSPSCRAARTPSLFILSFLCQTPSKTQTDEETNDRRQESNLVHFNIRMWHLVAIFQQFSW